MSRIYDDNISPRDEMSSMYDADMDGSRVSAIGAALADPNRGAMISALQSGRAHSAGELARWCGVAPSTASAHLSKLVDAGLVVIEPAGRNRFYRIASVEVADLLEMMDAIDLPETNKPKRPRPGTALAYARSCYDHLAGELAVGIFASMTEQGWVTDDDGPRLSTAGERELIEIGVDIDRLRGGRRPLMRSCLDWTERQQHLAGATGAALLDHMLENRWLRRARDHRVLRITDTGRHELRHHFGLIGL